MGELDSAGHFQGAGAFADPGSRRSPKRSIADQGMLHKVLSMLVGNARQVHRRGRSSLAVPRWSPPAAASMLRFSVSDTGIGIAEEDLERIFNDFTQSDGSITRAFPGLGLGLTLARRIIELMEGRIWAESRPGVGSIFHAEIPLLLPEPAATGEGCRSACGGEIA